MNINHLHVQIRYFEATGNEAKCTVVYEIFIEFKMMFISSFVEDFIAKDFQKDFPRACINHHSPFNLLSFFICLIPYLDYGID